MAKKRSVKSKSTINSLVELKKMLASLEANILSLKKQITAEDKKSANYLEKITKLEALRSKNRNEYLRIKKEIKKIENETLKSIQKQQNIESNLSKLSKEQTKQRENQTSQKDKDVKLSKEQQQLKKTELKFEKDIFELQEKSAILMQSINKDILKKAETLKITGQSVAEIANKTEEIKKLFAGTREETEAFEKTLGETYKNASGIDILSAKIAENMENMKEKGYALVDTYQLERNLKEQSVRLDLNKKKLGSERYDIQKKMLTSQIQEFNRLKEINKQLAEKSKHSKEIRNSMVGWIAAVPGGNFLLNKLGLGKILTESKGIKETIKGWGVALKGLGSALPFMAVAGFIAIFTKVFELAIQIILELDRTISDLSKKFAIGRGAATGMFSSLGAMALKMNVVGINVKELADSLSYMVDEYGIALDKIQNYTSRTGFLQGMTILREKFSLTNEEAENFGKVANSLGMTMDGLAFNAERMSKGVLNTKSAFKAIGNVPMVIAVGMKNAVQDLVRFVAKAKMMGIDIKGFTENLKGFLDIENSLEKQMTSQVLTGFQFENIDKIRELSNVPGQEKKVLDLVLQDLEKVFRVPLEQIRGGKEGIRTIAETLQITEDQFYDYYNRYNQIAKIFGTSSPLKKMEKLMNMNANELNAAAKKTKNAAQRDFLIKEAQARTGASLEETIEDKKQKIQIQMMGTLTDQISKLHTILNNVFNSSEFKTTIQTVSELLPKVFDGMIWAGNEMVKQFQKAFDLAKKIREVLVDIGFIVKTPKKGPLKPGEDPYNYDTKTFFGEGTEWLTWLMAGAGLWGAGKLAKKGIKAGGKKVFDLLKEKMIKPKTTAPVENLQDISKSVKPQINDIKPPQAPDVRGMPKKMKTKMMRDYQNEMRKYYNEIDPKKAKFPKTPNPSNKNLVFDPLLDNINKTDDIAKEGSLFKKFKDAYSKVPKSAATAGKKIPYLSLLLGGIDAGFGYSQTEERFGLKEGQTANRGQKTASILGNLLESGTLNGLFGLFPQINSENITKGLYENYKRQREKYKKGEYLSLTGDLLANPISAAMHLMVPGDSSEKYGEAPTKKSKSKVLSAGMFSFDQKIPMQQDTTNIKKQSPEDLKKLNEQLQILGGDRTWQASKATNEVAKAVKLLGENLVAFYSSGAQLTLGYITKTFDSVNVEKIFYLSNALSFISSTIVDLSKKLSTLDISKLERVAQAAQPGLLSTISGAAGNIFSGVKSFLGISDENEKVKTLSTSPTSAFTDNKNYVTSNQQSTNSLTLNTSALEQKIEKLISIMTNMATQPTYIKIGEQTVEAIRSEINWKKQNIIGVDNRYSGGSGD